MLLLIAAIAVVFTFSAFLATLPTPTDTYSFFSFFSYQADFILHHFMFFMIASIILVIFFVRTVRFEKTHTLHKKFWLTITQVFALCIIGIFCAYTVLLIIAWIELNSVATIININPRVLGIISDKKTIVRSLQSANEPPTIIASDKDSYQQVVAIAEAITGKNNFYGEALLKTIPSFLVLPTQPISSIFLLDNTLIITSINATDLQSISPYVGYMFVKSYFPLRTIRYYPNIVVLKEKSYDVDRIGDLQDKLNALESQIVLTNRYISSTSAAIDADTATVTADQSLIQQTYREKETAEKKCFAAGSYVVGIFVHTNSQAYCENQVTPYDTTVETLTSEIDKLTKRIADNKKQVELDKTYLTFFAAQKNATAILSKNIPHELGVFRPIKTIRIVIDSSNSHAIADYFETVVHEYLHYASFQEKKAFSLLFFEEGLTEYFARQAIANSLKTSTNLGYPVFVKIIKEMTKSIPETDLADIYFTKDQDRLETTLNRVYGENFYKNNALRFATLQYASNQNQVLSIANTIMKDLGGKPLTKQDLYSTLSNL